MFSWIASCLAMAVNLAYIHPLYILPEDIEFDIDRARYTECSDIGHAPSMRDEWYCEVVISGSDDCKADAIQGYTSLLDDEVPILAIEVDPHEVWVICITNNLRYDSNCIDMSCDEVSIDTGFSSDAPFNIERVSNFFRSEVRPRKTLFHSKKCITLGCDIRQSHTDSVVCDTLSDSEWLIVEVILHHEVTTFTGDDTRCAFDNSGEQEE